jgi:hypothetical protein
MMTTDTAKLLMETAIQVLIILLDYGHPIRSRPLLRKGSSEKMIESSQQDSYYHDLPFVYADDVTAYGFNIFRRLLHSISSVDQLNFIYRGFVRLLNNVHEVASSIFPYSVERVRIEEVRCSDSHTCCTRSYVIIATMSNCNHNL